MNINGVQQAGMYGLLGVILSCLGVLPYIGLLCAIAALVLIVLANKQLATETGDEAIFKGTLIFVVLTFVAVLVGLLLGGAAALVMAKKTARSRYRFRGNTKFYCGLYFDSVCLLPGQKSLFFSCRAF